MRTAVSERAVELVHEIFVQWSIKCHQTNERLHVCTQRVDKLASLLSHNHKHMMDSESKVTVYVVQALSRTTAEFALLGIFDTEARAQAFIDQAPMPQRECLHIHPWRLNHYTEDEFWRAGYNRLTEAGFREAMRKADASEE